jgi:hypothetical protein
MRTRVRHKSVVTGRPACNAIERFFPAHGERCSPETYINACTGTYYMNGHPEP